MHGRSRGTRLPGERSGSRLWDAQDSQPRKTTVHALSQSQRPSETKEQDRKRALSGDRGPGLQAQVHGAALPVCYGRILLSLTVT